MKFSADPFSLSRSLALDRTDAAIEELRSAWMGIRGAQAARPDLSLNRPTASVAVTIVSLERERRVLLRELGL
jgi:hypothetical protein